MEDFLLGLLMANMMTAYELHLLIKKNYEGICSDSIGNIQRALKILHKKGFVIFNEATEGKVVKKIFEITPAGRAHFMRWLSSPLAITKARNMELGKFLLLGFLSPAKRLATIDGQIKEIEEELEYLKIVEASIDEIPAESITAMRKAYIEANKDYMDAMMDSVDADDPISLMADVSKYAHLTLKFGLDESQFVLEWFQGLRDAMLLEK